MPTYVFFLNSDFQTIFLMNNYDFEYLVDMDMLFEAYLVLIT